MRRKVLTSSGALLTCFEGSFVAPFVSYEDFLVGWNQVRLDYSFDSISHLNISSGANLPLSFGLSFFNSWVCRRQPFAKLLKVNLLIVFVRVFPALSPFYPRTGGIARKYLKMKMEIACAPSSLCAWRVAHDPRVWNVFSRLPLEITRFVFSASKYFTIIFRIISFVFLVVVVAVVGASLPWSTINDCLSAQHTREQQF